MSNYNTQALRDSAPTSGPKEQDDPVALPQGVHEVFVKVAKTAEANTDNLLTVRLRALVGSDWVDVPYSWSQKTSDSPSGNVTVQNKVNILDADNDSAPVVLAYYDSMPSHIIRIVSASSGTTPANTFSAMAFWF